MRARGERVRPVHAATKSRGGPASQSAARAQSSRTRGHAPPPVIPPLSLRHPAMLVVIALAVFGIVLSVSFQIVDTDFWQHLLVGKALWQLHRVPQEHLWTWANFGVRDVLPSWGFRALIWPVWDAFGVTGLFAWRWASSLVTFAFAWFAARAMGARGMTPLVVAVWCSLVYRHRSQIRPETLAAVLMAAQLWILATRRSAPHGGGALDRAWALVPLAWVWANSHISYFMFFLVLGLHVADEAWRQRALPRTLALVFVASLTVSFVNPFGAAALWQPFDYALRLSKEPMFKGIGELQPLSWLNNQTNGVFVMLALWPLLMLWRARKHGIDRVELVMCVFFTWYLVRSERFFGNYAVAAAVYLARDLDGFVRSRRWPAWSASAWARAGLAAGAILAIGAAEWSRLDRPLTVSIDMKRFPVEAMNFMERHGVKGHGFSQTRVAGYQLWRFWPDRERLPFMDIHQSGTPEDRTLYTRALSRGSGWRELDRGRRFDYVVLDPYLADSLLAGLDADTTMSLVFLDDAGAVYVRRGRSLAAVADAFGYHVLGAGPDKIARGFAAAATDSAARAALVMELERLAGSSPLDARAHSLRATLALSEQRLDDARLALTAALRTDPRTPLAHFRLAGIALFQNRPQDAIGEFERERELNGARPGIDLGIGMAYRASNNVAEARKHFALEARRWPGSPSATAAERAAAEAR